MSRRQDVGEVRMLLGSAYEIPEALLKRSCAMPCHAVPCRAMPCHVQCNGINAGKIISESPFLLHLGGQPPVFGFPPDPGSMSESPTNLTWDDQNLRSKQLLISQPSIPTPWMNDLEPMLNMMYLVVFLKLLSRCLF